MTNLNSISEVIEEVSEKTANARNFCGQYYEIGKICQWFGNMDAFLVKVVGAMLIKNGPSRATFSAVTEYDLDADQYADEGWDDDMGEYNTDYGYQFVNLINHYGLGEVKDMGEQRVNTNSSNMVTMWLWKFDRPKLMEWYKKFTKHEPAESCKVREAMSKVDGWQPEPHVFHAAAQFDDGAAYAEYLEEINDDK